MKKLFFVIAATTFLVACGNNETSTNSSANNADQSSAKQSGSADIVDDVSDPTIVQIAAKSSDHTTLVTAVKAADLVNSLSTVGPFTVFAPTNAAFDKLPKGTVEGLLKPEKKNDLINILGYHTYVGVLDGVLLQDGAEYDMVFGGKVKITEKDGKKYVNGSEILGTIKASNGVIHVIGDVLLPK
ncbi:MAG: fasciclin domain-containing protein [Chitinophagales bacterium]|nr:fasciclin domain-containing protein [Chitinophagales bacterium]